MAGVGQVVKNLGPARVLALMGAIAAVVGFLVVLTSRFSTPNYALLYSDLELKDSGAIVRQLDEMQVPYEIRGNGEQILVPSDQVGRLRMLMAEAGLPGGGNIGYELFDQSEALGTSHFVQNINRVRALEGELARTIAALQDVEQARVHLVLPERKLFTREQDKPTASIVLKLRSSGLNRQKVQAIQHITAAAVPGLMPGDVSVIDDRGNLLARGFEEEDGMGAMSNATEMRQSYENRLARQLETLLERTLGPGKVRAEVSADMNFDRTTKNSEIYDPEGQVVRSSQVVEERTNNTEKDPEKVVSVINQLPDLANLNDQASVTNQESVERIDETTNYEISRTVENKVSEAGNVKRVSVAVLVDGNYTTDAEGKSVYQPRTEAEIDQLESLVKSAIGFDANRGDQVEIINMQFAAVQTPFDDSVEPTIELTKDDYLKLAELLVMGLVGILVMLLVVRPILNRVLESIPAPAPSPSGNNQLLLDDQSAGSRQQALPGAVAAQQQVEETQNSSAEIEQMINLQQIEGQIRASSVKRIGEMVEKYPDEAVNILRGWLYQQEGTS